jgi:hypothetical protein
MKIKVLVAVSFTLAITNVEARFVSSWSYDSLAKGSDCIAIVQVSSSTEYTNEKVNHHGNDYAVCLTKFKVITILKGDATRTELSLCHYQNTKDRLGELENGNIVEVSPYGFMNFSKSDTDTYLVFFKNYTGGLFIPSESQWDTVDSFVKIPNDSATRMDELFRKKDVDTGDKK